MYNDEVRNRASQPPNVGPLEGATHHGLAGTPGDGPYIYLTLIEEGGVISKAAFNTHGCPAAIASASVAAELCEGKSLEDISLLTEADIMSVLIDLPEGKEHCPKLGADALKNIKETKNAKPS